MKRAKRIYILLGILAAACLITFAVTRMEEKKEQIKNSEEVILELSEDSVQKLSWNYEETELAFHRDDDGLWSYDDDKEFPVDEDKINGLLEQFASFSVSFVIEDVEDYGQYGLDEPLCTIQLETSGETYEISLGNYSNMDSQRYLSIGDGNVYLAQTDPLETFEVGLNDLIAQDEIPVFSQAETITFEGTENYSIQYKENSGDTYRSEDVYFTEKDGDNQPLDTDKIESYLESLSSLNLTDYVTYKASEEELKTYGLDAPELTVTVKGTSEDADGEEVTESVVLNISSVSDEEKETSGDDEEEITAYVRVGDSGIIYRISESDYDALTKASYNDLRHSEVIPAEFEDISKMEVTLEGKTYTITSEEKKGEYIYSYKNKELDISQLQSAAEALKAYSFTDQEPDGEEEISMTLYLDDENETKIQVKLYRYDGTYCLAEVDKKTVALVKRSLAVDLIEAINSIVL